MPEAYRLRMYDQLPPRLRKILQEHALYIDELTVKMVYQNCGFNEIDAEIRLMAMVRRNIRLAATADFGPDHPQARQETPDA